MAAVVVGLLATGCAGPVATPSAPPSPSEAVSTAAVPSPDVASPTGPGDAAPHQAENNRWKQRHELTAEEQNDGDVLAARVRSALTELRPAGDFSPDAVRRALLGLGLEPEQVLVTEMRTPLTADSPPLGAVFAVQFGGSGCVVGDVRPERLLVEVTGAAAEFGCLEPASH